MKAQLILMAAILFSVNSFAFDCVRFRYKQNDSWVRNSYEKFVTAIKEKKAGELPLKYIFEWTPSFVSKETFHNCPDKVFLSVNEGEDNTSNTGDIFHLQTTINKVCFYAAHWDLDDNVQRVACLND